MARDWWRALLGGGGELWEYNNLLSTRKRFHKSAPLLLLQDVADKIQRESKQKIRKHTQFILIITVYKQLLNDEQHDT